MLNEKVICSQYAEGVWDALNYGSRQVRTFYLGGTLWWVLSDVCSVINLSNAPSAASRLYEYEKMTITLADSHSQQRGGAQKLIVINESGLYHLLLTSNKPAAKTFQRWVTTEVLPSIRKNGGYIMGQDFMDADKLADAADIIVQNILVEQDQRIQGLLVENAEQAALLRECEPKVLYYDAVLSSQGAVAVSVIAKAYGRSAQWLHNYLHVKGIQYKCNSTWLLYQPYATEDYTRSHPILCGSPYYKELTCWTPKGRAFIYNLLKSDGILPLSERMNVSRDIEDCCLRKLCPRPDRQ